MKKVSKKVLVNIGLACGMAVSVVPTNVFANGDGNNVGAAGSEKLATSSDTMDEGNAGIMVPVVCAEGDVYINGECVTIKADEPTVEDGIAAIKKDPDKENEVQSWNIHIHTNHLVKELGYNNKDDISFEVVGVDEFNGTIEGETIDIVDSDIRINRGNRIILTDKNTNERFVYTLGVQGGKPDKVGEINLWIMDGGQGFCEAFPEDESCQIEKPEEQKYTVTVNYLTKVNGKDVSIKDSKTLNEKFTNEAEFDATGLYEETIANGDMVYIFDKDASESLTGKIDGENIEINLYYNLKASEITPSTPVGTRTVTIEYRLGSQNGEELRFPYETTYTVGNGYDVTLFYEDDVVGWDGRTYVLNTELSDPRERAKDKDATENVTIVLVYDLKETEQGGGGETPESTTYTVTVNYVDGNGQVLRLPHYETHDKETGYNVTFYRFDTVVSDAYGETYVLNGEKSDGIETMSSESATEDVEITLVYDLKEDEEQKYSVTVKYWANIDGTYTEIDSKIVGSEFEDGAEYNAEGFGKAEINHDGKTYVFNETKSGELTGTIAGKDVLINLYYDLEETEQGGGETDPNPTPDPEGPTEPTDPQTPDVDDEDDDEEIDDEDTPLTPPTEEETEEEEIGEEDTPLVLPEETEKAEEVEEEIIDDTTPEVGLKDDVTDTGVVSMSAVGTLSVLSALTMIYEVLRRKFNK